MPHHFPKNTFQAEVWCNKCRKMTPWRILGGKRAYCMTCYDKLTSPAVKKDEPPPDSQQNLFN